MRGAGLNLPWSAMKPCLQPMCPELVRGAARCPAHTKKKNAERGSSRQRGYTSEWDRPGGIRLTHLAKHPLCAMCEAEGRTTPATVVDHILRWQAGATEEERQRRFRAPENLRSLCASHHGLKTVQEDGGFGRPKA